MDRKRGALVEDYNYKVVVKLKSDLSETDREIVIGKIEDLQRRLKLIKSDDVTYHKAAPIHEYDDFGAVTLFYCALEDMKEYFERLEYYNLWENRKRVAV